MTDSSIINISDGVHPVNPAIAQNVVNRRFKLLLEHAGLPYSLARPHAHLRYPPLLGPASIATRPAFSRARLANHDPVLEEGVVHSDQMGDRADLAYFLEGMAVVSASRGKARHAPPSARPPSRRLGGLEGRWASSKP